MVSFRRIDLQLTEAADLSIRLYQSQEHASGLELSYCRDSASTLESDGISALS